MKHSIRMLMAAMALAATPMALAYQVEGKPQAGFFFAQAATTAPLMVETSFWNPDIVTPQEFLERKCPGATVSEINVVRVKRNPWDAFVQIVFVMPANGCLEQK